MYIYNLYYLYYDPMTYKKKDLIDTKYKKKKNIMNRNIDTPST